MSDPAPSAPEPARFPPGLHNAFLFAAFNALSFPIVCGSPMILYAKTLGASATVLGIITGMMPLLTVFQIPAASHIGRVGYRRFVYAGWGMRVMFIGGMAVVPLLSGVLDATARLSLMLMLLFAFNLSRGISSCAWLPWITTLVPEQVRGQYLGRDAACVNLASFAVIVMSAFALGEQPAPWQFTALYVFSAAMGATSLVFLKRIPDVAPPAEAQRDSGEPVPWLAISAHPPFRKLLRMNVAWALAVGGLGAFTTAWNAVQRYTRLAQGPIRESFCAEGNFNYFNYDVEPIPQAAKPAGGDQGGGGLVKKLGPAQDRFNPIEFCQKFV